MAERRIEDLTLTPLHEKILNYVSKVGSINRSKVRDITSASRSSAWRYLFELTHAGYLKREGVGTSTYYVLAPKKTES